MEKLNKKKYFFTANIGKNVVCFDILKEMEICRKHIFTFSLLKYFRY